MKSMIIAAAALGVAIAGIILFYKSETHPHEELADAVMNRIDDLNSDAPHLERGQHAMG